MHTFSVVLHHSKDALIVFESRSYPKPISFCFSFLQILHSFFRLYHLFFNLTLVRDLPTLLCSGRMNRSQKEIHWFSPNWVDRTCDYLLLLKFIVNLVHPTLEKWVPRRFPTSTFFIHILINVSWDLVSQIAFVWS